MATRELTLSFFRLFIGVLCLTALPSFANDTSTWQPCHVDNVSMRLECMTIEVPKQTQDPANTFSIHIVKVAAAKSNIYADPLLFLAGGPGQAASDVVASVLPAFRRTQTQRDIYFIDQRGTGKSEPLFCDEPIIDALLQEIGSNQTINETQDCAALLNDQLGYFSTEQSVDDLEFIRKQLNIPQFNLYGGSYGTRIAQVYMRKYPEAIRSVILDAVVPMNFAIGDFDASVNASWLGLLDQCSQHSACQQVFPDLAGLMQLAQETLSTATIVELPHPTQGNNIEPKISNLQFLSSLRSMLYHPSTRALIPYTIKATSEGDYRPLLSQLSLAQNQRIATGLFLEITCNEDFDLWQQSERTAYDFDNGVLSEQYQLMCEHWPKNKQNYAFDRSPVISDIPTLLISGEYDPVTPPSNAVEVANGLSNHRHIVVKGAAHTALFHSCLSTSIDKFIDSAEVDRLEVSCLEDAQPHWFMTGINLIE
ncbi:alpha/beta hydrolase [Reinekea sp.]|jgi:pimeloyl-ACP methyl ester carboxylesterase|uniref:alpha/beta hydrolase n=1 Tax=Reinekea sp. TaxID=1970455 RepID=UPI003989019F